MNMKAMIRTSTLLALWALLHFSAAAQFSATTTLPGYTTFGINGGWSYQTSDVRAAPGGFGFGLTLGKNLYYQPGAPLSFDLRGRLLYARQFGLDHFRSFDIDNNEALNGDRSLDYTSYPAGLGVGDGFVFQNHRTDLGELALEGVLTLNQLKERTGFLASLYGGVGLDWYRTRIDQANPFGLEYFTEYSSIDPSRPKASIRKDLSNTILDGVYESNADGFTNSGKLGLMPSVGIELGYQFTPTFALTAGHRLTFSGTNLLDGHQWEDNQNDLYHYTSLGLQWTIPRKPRRATGPSPQIKVLLPATTPYRTPDPNGLLRAKILHVNSPADIQCTVNGRPVNFDFFSTEFTTRFFLELGKNEVVLTASNPYGTDRVVRTIILETGAIINPPPPPPSGAGPQVRIVDPSRETYRTERDRHDLRASIQGIRDKSEVELTVNGRGTRDFIYDNRTRELRATISLRPGDNRISVRATNPYGSDRDEVNIVREEEIRGPSVRIVVPNDDPHRTDFDQADIRATIERLGNNGTVRFFVNGRASNDFRLNGNTLDARISLRPGENQVVVRAENSAGNDQDEVAIIFEPVRPTSQPPKVRITRPDRPNSTTSSQRADIEASLEYVSRKEDIDFRLNGQRLYDFDYRPQNGRLTHRIELREGNNRISIEVVNADGRDQDAVDIRYLSEPGPVKQPPTVEITEPANNSAADQPSVILRAETRHIGQANQIDLRVNGRRITDFTFNGGSGKLQATVSLKSGDNDIRIKVTNSDGSDEDQVKVRYRGAQPPKVSITEPRNNSEAGSSRIAVRADIEHVSSNRHIDFYVNGRRISDFDFSSSSGKFSAEVDLRPGDNTISITVNNSDGSDNDAINVRYREAPPKVSITEPRNNSEAVSGRISVRADIQNVDNSRDIEFRVNGRQITNFNFSNGRFSANADLKEGDNAISVKVSNDNGSDEDQVKVRYRAPLARPEVRFLTPARPGQNVSETTTQIKVSIKNIDSKDDIEFRVNGRKETDFQFNPRSESMEATVELKEGRNELAVTATNESGKGSDDTHLVLKQRNPQGGQNAKPTVAIESITQPATNPLSPNVATSGLLATITGVRNKSQIEITVNGKEVDDWSFDASTGKLEATLVLNRGSNLLKIKASSRAGSDEASQNIDF